MSAIIARIIEFWEFVGMSTNVREDALDMLAQCTKDFKAIFVVRPNESIDDRVQNMMQMAHTHTRWYTALAEEHVMKNIDALRAQGAELQSMDLGRYETSCELLKDIMRNLRRSHQLR
jgi:hypothetical protein